VYRRSEKLEVAIAPTSQLGRQEGVPDFKFDDHWLLYINADEVLDVKRFSQWWLNGTMNDFDVVQLAANVYHDNDPLTPVGAWDIGGLLIREPFATRSAILYTWDRYDCYN
jgi:hypothetical protein